MYGYYGKFLKRTPEGIEQWTLFKEKMLENENEASTIIGKVLEQQWGYTAMHHGKFPKDWVKPGGNNGDSYRQTCAHMETSAGVIEKRELKAIKCLRERKLCKRRSNIINHCGTHKCSSYCLKGKKVSVEYNEASHSDISESDRFINSNGKQMIHIIMKDCRMKFGKPLIYGHSGENNLTRGIEMKLLLKVDFDNNGFSKKLQDEIILG